LGDAKGLLRHPEDEVVPHKSESLDLYRQLDDKWGIAFQLSELGRLAVWQGKYDLARARLEEALRTGGFGDKWSVAHVLRSLGDIALFQHDSMQAVLLYEESLALYRELGDKFRSSTCLRNLAGVSLCEGDTERAAQLFQESLQIAFALQNVPNVALCLGGMAALALVRGWSERAATLFGMSDALREASQGMLPPADLLLYRRYFDLTREKLGAEAFDRSWKTGQLVTLDKAVIYARSAASAPELGSPLAAH
jgi:tetratricopeptide (TPR) repeat protein